MQPTGRLHEATSFVRLRHSHRCGQRPAVVGFRIEEPASQQRGRHLPACPPPPPPSSLLSHPRPQSPPPHPPSPPAHLDLDVSRLALRATQRLVDHDAAVGQRVALALVAGGQEESTHGGGQAHADGGHVGADVAHRVEHSHACGCCRAQGEGRGVRPGTGGGCSPEEGPGARGSGQGRAELVYIPQAALVWCSTPGQSPCQNWSTTCQRAGPASLLGGACWAPHTNKTSCRCCLSFDRRSSCRCWLPLPHHARPHRSCSHGPAPAAAPPALPYHTRTHRSCSHGPAPATATPPPPSPTTPDPTAPAVTDRHCCRSSRPLPPQPPPPRVPRGFLRRATRHQPRRTCCHGAAWGVDVEGDVPLGVRTVQVQQLQDNRRNAEVSAHDPVSECTPGSNLSRWSSAAQGRGRIHCGGRDPRTVSALATAA